MGKRILLLKLLTPLLVVPHTVGFAGDALLYNLGPESTFADGCFELCDCLVYFSEDLEGTFRLTPMGRDGDFESSTLRT